MEVKHREASIRGVMGLGMVSTAVHTYNEKKGRV